MEGSGVGLGVAVRSRTRWDNRDVHIWMLNHYTATPEKDGGESRHSLLATHLQAFGWETTIIAASVSHPSGEQKLKGWQLIHKENNQNYDAYWVRVPSYGSNGLRRGLGMLVFGLVSIVPGIFPRIKKPDVVLGSAVHHFAALAAWALARRYRVPFVFEVRDVWPEVLVDFSLLKEKGFPSWILRKVSKFLCSQATLVLSPLPQIGRWVAEMGLESKETLWVSNGTDPAYLPEVLPLPHRPPFIFLYLGSFGNINALEELVTCFSRFRRQFPELNCNLRLMGEGWKKEKIHNLIGDLGAQSFVSVEPGVAKQRAMLETQGAHCLVIPIKDARAHRKFGISPNKLFDYLLAGRTILFLGDDPLDLVSSAGAGVAAEFSDEKGVIEAMRRVVTASDDELLQFGKNGRELALKEFSFSALGKKLSDGLTSITKP